MGGSPSFPIVKIPRERVVIVTGSNTGKILLNISAFPKIYTKSHNIWERNRQIFRYFTRFFFLGGGGARGVSVKFLLQRCDVAHGIATTLRNITSGRKRLGV